MSMKGSGSRGGEEAKDDITRPPSGTFQESKVGVDLNLFKSIHLKALKICFKSLMVIDLTSPHMLCLLTVVDV